MPILNVQKISNRIKYDCGIRIWKSEWQYLKKTTKLVKQSRAPSQSLSPYNVCKRWLAHLLNIQSRAVRYFWSGEINEHREASR